MRDDDGNPLTVDLNSEQDYQFCAEQLALLGHIRFGGH